MMKKILILFLTLMATSCIYPFTPEPVDGSGSLVIEGDILIGNISVFNIGHTVPITNPEAEPEHPNGKIWVENDAGAIFDGFPDPSKPGVFNVDTQYADPEKQYRLHFIDNDKGKEYISDWERVCGAPEIDSLSYILDYDKAKLNIALSMHSRGESFFRWSYVEDWQYNSDFFAYVKFVVDVPSGWRRSGHLEYADHILDNTYICYDHAVSTKILTFSTEKQTDDRFVDLEFLPINQDDLRIQNLYRIVVSLEPLTKDAYLYWENIKTNSEYNGNLFAPNPSELVGNIRCVQNPDELVMGYVNVAQIARKQLVIDDIDINFYKSSQPPYEIAELSQRDYNEYYFEQFYLPYGTIYPPGDLTQTYWAPARCVDCIYGGGTREKPEDWPPTK